ncbi:MAG TPA: hypothetical protein VKT49_00030 [Bryobacteraceae bacterium]|nr:hypothetical protein [Bryobacteraceae bacterium]
MWGALTFLLLFLVIDPTTRAVILVTLEEARLHLAVEAPLSYFLLVVLGGSALVSALIMKFWPRTQAQSQHVRILHRYQGRTAIEMAESRPAPSLALRLIVELTCLRLPLRARLACGRVLRSFAGRA